MMRTINTTTRPVHILVADDDQDDCLLMKEAFEESRAANTMSFVHNGEELMAYLLRRPPFTNEKDHPLPALILLDLNMPLMDGREALAEIKQHSHLCKIPVVILTTSSSADDIARSYAAGVNSYITKPVTFTGLVDVTRTLGEYWLELVELPSVDGGLE